MLHLLANAHVLLSHIMSIIPLTCTPPTLIAI